MKKTLLSFAILCAASAGMANAASPNVETAYTLDRFDAIKPEKVEKARANAESVTPYLYFGNADFDNSSALKMNGLKARQIVYQAVKFKKADQAKFQGCRIAGLRVQMGSSATNQNQVTKISGFVTDELNSLPEFKQAFTVSATAFGIHDLRFTNPYEFDGEKDLYFGYSFILPADPNNCYWIVCDQNLRTTAENYMCVTNAAKDVPTDWGNYSSQCGNLCISLIIEGDNLPTDLASIKNVGVDPFYTQGVKMNYYMTIANKGANVINNVEVETTLSDGTVYKKTVTLDTPVEVGGEGEVHVTNVPNNGLGMIELSSKITKVNGTPLEECEPASAVYATYSEGYPRNLVTEEATATGCQYCPAGIVMMEYLKKTYPDRWIRIAVHCNAYNDPIPCNSYKNWVSDYIPGFPTAVINRVLQQGFTNSAAYNNKYCDTVYDYFTGYPAYTKVDLAAECNESNSSVNVTASTEFAFDIDAKYPHKLSFVVVEDGVGPHSQTNGYSGTSAEMDGWQNKGQFVSTIYDDVARIIVNYPGIANSIPADIKEKTPYTYSTSIPISNVENKTFRVVALVTNATTGEIVNASEVTVAKTGIDAVTDFSNFNVYGGKGCITVSCAENVNVYSLDGRRVGTENLPAGVYIVNADGKAVKVYVK